MDLHSQRWSLRSRHDRCVDIAPAHSRAQNWSTSVDGTGLRSRRGEDYCGRLERREGSRTGLVPQLVRQVGCRGPGGSQTVRRNRHRYRLDGCRLPAALATNERNQQQAICSVPIEDLSTDTAGCHCSRRGDTCPVVHPQRADAVRERRGPHSAGSMAGRTFAAPATVPRGCGSGQDPTAPRHRLRQQRVLAAHRIRANPRYRLLN